MKQEFSTHWIASVQPRKQRKYKANAPFHIRQKFIASHLSKELRKKYGHRSIAIRKGDEVLIMRGSFKKKKAKVVSVDLTRTRVTLENIQRSKKDGTKVNVYFHPSALMIQTLNVDDKLRVQALARNKDSSKIVKPKKASREEQQSKPQIKSAATKETPKTPEKNKPTTKPKTKV